MNPTDSSLFWSISWRHVIAMISFQSLRASYGDSHGRGKLPPSPPLFGSGDSGSHALADGALSIQGNQSGALTTFSATLSTVQLVEETYISFKGQTKVERYLKFISTGRVNSGLIFAGNLKQRRDYMAILKESINSLSSQKKLESYLSVVSFILMSLDFIFLNLAFILVIILLRNKKKITKKLINTPPLLGLLLSFHY